MAQAGQRRELAAQLALVFRLGGAAGGELLQREPRAGPQAVLDQPHPAGAALPEHPLEPVPVAPRLPATHGRIIGSSPWSIETKANGDKVCLGFETAGKTGHLML